MKLSGRFFRSIAMEHFAPKCPQCHEDLPCETLRGVGVLSWEKKKPFLGSLMSTWRRRQSYPLFEGVQQQEESQWLQNVPERLKHMEKRFPPKDSGSLEQIIQRGCTNCWAGLCASGKGSPFHQGLFAERKLSCRLCIDEFLGEKCQKAVGGVPQKCQKFWTWAFLCPCPIRKEKDLYICQQDKYVYNWKNRQNSNRSMLSHVSYDECPEMTETSY